MKVLLTGSAGQLGNALISQQPKILSGKRVELIACTRKELNLADPDAIYQLVNEQRPDWVINAGAFTNVDQAEKDFALAKAVNALAPAAFADALSEFGGRLLQLSTDFVFNGKQGSPYKPHQGVDPLGVYGASKAEGEIAALRLPGARLLRTSWVYGPIGKNFCLTMLRLHEVKASADEPIGVVADQVGCPTATHTLAKACWRALELEDSEQSRILHWSDAGAASWYDFAIAIGELGIEVGLLDKSAVVKSIKTIDYPTPAKRPSFSILDCSITYRLLGFEPLYWRNALREVLLKVSKRDN